MKFKKLFLCFMSFSLLSQTIVLVAQETQTAREIITELGLHVGLATKMLFKKVFDHNLFGIIITTPEISLNANTSPNTYASATVNPYSITTSKVFLGSCALGIIGYIGYKIHEKMKTKEEERKKVVIYHS